MTGAAAETRREALSRAALAAGALVAGAILHPGVALAQSADDEDLRDFLVEAIALEQLTVLAYATASTAKGVDSALRQQLEDLRDQEQAHANALRSALDSLGFDAPAAPDSPTDTAVLDAVEGLSDEASERFADLLTELDGLSQRDELLELIAELEGIELDLYVGRGPDLDSEDLSTTAAELAGCQTQHLIALRTALGDDPAAALSVAAQAVEKAGAVADE